MPIGDRFGADTRRNRESGDRSGKPALQVSWKGFGRFLLATDSPRPMALVKTCPPAALQHRANPDSWFFENRFGRNDPVPFDKMTQAAAAAGFV